MLAPIFIPLFLRLDVAPQTVLAAYRVGDSPIERGHAADGVLPADRGLRAALQARTPGIGTVVSLMLPVRRRRSRSCGRCSSSPGTCSGSRSARARRSTSTDGDSVQAGGAAAGSFVSTGALPPQEQVHALVDEAYARYGAVYDGAPSSVYPALAEVDPDLFGISVASVGGEVHAVGDAGVAFPLMSVAKPFAFALRLRRRRPGGGAAGRGGRTPPACPSTRSRRRARARRPHEPDGQPGRDRDRRPASPERPPTSAGRAGGGAERIRRPHADARRRDLASARATNHAIAPSPAAARPRHAAGARSTERSTCTPARAACGDGARPRRDGATLADGGVNPLTGAHVVSADACRHALGAMATAGLYETSGDWLFDVGLPGKSGIGGGIVTVAPGKGALGTFAPPLDAAGNSVRGQLVARFLSRGARPGRVRLRARSRVARDRPRGRTRHEHERRARR